VSSIWSNAECGSFRFLHISDQIRNHSQQGLIAGCNFNNLLTRRGMWPGAATHINSDCLYHLVSDSCLEAAEADVGRLVISASCRTSRPVHPHRCSTRTEALFQRIRQLCRVSLSVDLREIAVVRSGACHEAAPERGGRRRKLLQQVFLQQSGNALNLSSFPNKGSVPPTLLEIEICRQMRRVYPVDLSDYFLLADNRP
jgi:hypothetical protein